MTLGAASARATAAFVKPTEDKSFAAKVYASGAMLAAATALLPETTPVRVAEPVHWEIEYRCFAFERKLLACAPYLRDGEPLKDDAGNWLASTEASEEAVRYARTVLADSRVALPAGIVLDVGRIQGRGWAVVEANGAWGSGICGCAPADVLPVLARAIRPVAALTPNDARWTRTRYEVE